jgi:hypothetical protein
LEGKLIQVGELFIKLGIQGTDKSLSAISETRIALGKVASTSLEAKAAIVGIFYALQQLATESNVLGLNLQQFRTFTGQSVQVLQDLQYAFVRVGVSADETQNAIVGIEKAMANIALNKAAPEGISNLATVLLRAGKEFDIKKIQDPYYMIQKFREYAVLAKKLPGVLGLDAVINQVLGSFHLSDKFVTGLKSDLLKLDKAPGWFKYSDQQINNLAQMKIGWDLLFARIRKGFGELALSYEPALLAGLNKLIPQMLAFMQAVAEFSKAVHLLTGLSSIFKGWAEIFKLGTETVQDFKKRKITDVLKDYGHTLVEIGKIPVREAIPLVGGTHVNNVTLHSTVNVGDHANPQSIADAVTKTFSNIVNDTHRQYQQNGGM